MAVIRWNPWRDTMTLREATDRLLEDSFVRPRRRWGEGTQERPFHLPLDVYTTPDEIVITASLPGLAASPVSPTAASVLNASSNSSNRSS